ncbi:MAG TPA: GAP family protein [Ktedonobacterales bacterium]|nr:GAP family protein [Ktedonobacterales bacterium]
MGSVLIQLVPLVIGSIAMPSWVLLVLALLSSGRGTVEAIAVAVGVTTVRILQGIAFGTILSAYDLNRHLVSPGVIVSALLIVLGVLMWAMALRQIFQKDDLQLMRMVGALTPVRALGLGALLVVTSTRAWIFTLAALGVIEAAELDIAPSIIAYLLYVLGAEALIIAPILVSGRLSNQLAVAARWLEEYNRPILVVVSAAVGCFFLWRGIAGLIN